MKSQQQEQQSHPRTSRMPVTPPHLRRVQRLTSPAQTSTRLPHQSRPVVSQSSTRLTQTPATLGTYRNNILAQRSRISGSGDFVSGSAISALHESERERGSDVKIISTDPGLKGYIDDPIDPSIKTVEVISKSKKTANKQHTNTGNCAGCGVEEARFRYVTQNFICETCRKRAPHRLITRTTAMKQCGAAFDDLHAAEETGDIQVFVVPNYHAKGYYQPPPCHLYFLHEVEGLVEQCKQNRVE